jgi:hypothetical protein
MLISKKGQGTNHSAARKHTGAVVVCFEEGKAGTNGKDVGILGQNHLTGLLDTNKWMDKGTIKAKQGLWMVTVQVLSVAGRR